MNNVKGDHVTYFYRGGTSKTRPNTLAQYFATINLVSKLFSKKKLNDLCSLMAFPFKKIPIK